jgi:transposase
MGYNVHCTESCESDERHLITHIETTTAPVVDADATTLIHTAMKQKQLLPHLHIVDTAYLDAELLVTSKQQHGAICRKF